ncbi:Uncharacterised protein [uncultured Eubacterium sp.]|nr:Uncharacterised protein [uncultured Eubacterium sp.]
MRVNKLSVSVEQQAEMEYQTFQTEKQKMQMEYMSMMSGIDLPDEEGAMDNGEEQTI